MAVIFIGFILGFKDGFVRKLIGLLGLGLSIFLAVTYFDKLGKVIERYFGIELYLSEIIAFIFIFIVVIALFALLKRIVHPFDKVNNLINQLVGGFVGVIQILFFLSAVFFLLNIFNQPSKNARKTSIFYSAIYSIIPYSVDYLSNYTPETKKIFQDYFNQKDTLK